MKYLGLIVLAIVLFSASSFAQPSNTSVITNTAHNFSLASWNDANTGGTGKQICQPCHTPHNAVHKMEALWNHNSGSDNYVTWESSFVNGAYTFTEVGETSKLCLDCHDGQIAMSAFGGGSGTGNKMGGTPGQWGSMNLGTDLSDDHPINAPYTVTMVNGVPSSPKFEVKNGSVYVKPITGWDGSNAIYGSGKLRLTNTGTDYRVDCTTCHTPHGSANTSKADPFPYLLRMSNGASALCQTCHQK